MNGLSFSDFENSSFDSLYNRGFANAKHFDEVTRNMKPGEWMPKELGNGTARPSLLSHSTYEQPQARVPAAQYQALPSSMAAPERRASAMHGRNSQRALPSSDTQQFRTAQAVPLNDMGVMPGNTRVDHTWRPSQEANARAQHAPLALPSSVAPAAAPRGGGQQGTFVGWKSN
eukprot:TRINITY_DN82482_c0_g1_i1.p1 TRINITY_DN82482_c0_g1~~TRINITY_DN82482_c0_g1_i1.p1  ORF type:complete len:173 (-),score=28.33 TRINITY_DN82482_c0_g1_i1:112-630(-)